MKSKLYQFLRHPRNIVLGTLYHLAPYIPDKTYLKLVYYFHAGKRLNLKNPQRFNEKLQWLKLYNRRPEYSQMVDKYRVKDYVAQKIGSEYVIPTLGVWDSFDEIDFSSLPQKFVLKTTHGGGGGGVVICRDKASFDVEKAKERLNRSMADDCFTKTREWPYKNVRHRIIAEKLLEVRPDSVGDIPDYKWYCFNGEPMFCQVIQDRSSIETIDFFDTEWNHQEFVGLSPDANPAIVQPEKPANLSIQISIARELSKNLPFSRIDLYETSESTFFGEITLFPASGFGTFRPEKYNELLGQMIKLPGENRGGVIINLKMSKLECKLDISYPDLPDYKFFCFDGEVKALFVGSERQTGDVKFDFFDADFNHLDIVQYHPMSGHKIEKPRNFEKMKGLAAKLSEGLPHARIDLYDTGDRVYFGEITFFHHGGITPFHPEEWDYTFGSWLKLPPKTV